jgi:hypothetical protein
MNLPPVDLSLLLMENEEMKATEETQTKSDEGPDNCKPDLDHAITRFVYNRFKENGKRPEEGEKIEDPDFLFENNTFHMNYRFDIKHNLDHGEKIIDMFNCAIKQKILVQGYLYISTEALYFFSYWNDESALKFFSYGIHRCTRIKISYKDIIKIEKSNAAFIFDNSLTITVRQPVMRRGSESNRGGSIEMCTDEIFLTSFLSRDKCYKLMVERVMLHQSKLITSG